MKIKPIVIVLLSCLMMVTGCSSGSSGVKFNYPSGIESICYGERNAAKKCIEDVRGVQLRNSRDLILKKRPGERRINSYWAWRVPEINNIWATGLTRYRINDVLIEIGCNPNTFEEWKASTIRHEHGHYYLLTNFREQGHNAIYQNCFVNWRNPKTNMKSMATFIKGELVVIDYIEDKDVVTKETAEAIE